MAKTTRPRKVAPPKAAPKPGPEVLTAAERDADEQFALARAEAAEPVAVVVMEGEVTEEQAAEVKAAISVSGRKPRARKCNVADCERAPEYRGLCAAHWVSRRGEADPVG